MFNRLSAGIIVSLIVFGVRFYAMQDSMAAAQQVREQAQQDRDARERQRQQEQQAAFNRFQQHPPQFPAQPQFPGRPPFPGQPQAPPPPPEPARPILMHEKGVPAALAPHDLRRQLEDRYEAQGMAMITRDSDALLATVTDPMIDNGKKVGKAVLRKDFEKTFAEVNALEGRVNQPLRLGSHTDVLSVTPQGKDQACVEYRTVIRLTASRGAYRREITETGRDVWKKQGSTWLQAEGKTSSKQTHTFVNGQEVKE